MGAEGAESRVAPTTSAAPAQAVEHWAKAARPGERFVYFTGPALVRSLPVVDAVERLKMLGEVLTVQQRRGPHLFDYLVIKRRNVEPPPLSAAAVGARGSSVSRPGHPTGASQSLSDDLEDLMAVLRRHANLGRECPSNAELARLAGLKDAESARYRLAQLATCGRIAVRTPPQGPRVVTIVSSGRSTASVAPAGQPTPGAWGREL